LRVALRSAECEVQRCSDRFATFAWEKQRNPAQTRERSWALPICEQTAKMIEALEAHLLQRK